MTAPSLAHLAFVVPDLQAAATRYVELLSAEQSEVIELPEHGVRMIKIMMPGVLIELLHPMGENSPVAKFLEKNPRGSFHHMCMRVEDVGDYSKRLQTQGVNVLNNGVAKIGMEGEPVIFIHPHEKFGCMIELEQAGK